MLRKIQRSILVAMLLFAGQGKADHLRSSQIERGKPENRLGVIVLERTTKNDLVRLYGSPSDVRTILLN
jgi:hypothetical protein